MPRNYFVYIGNSFLHILFIYFHVLFGLHYIIIKKKSVKFIYLKDLFLMFWVGWKARIPNLIKPETGNIFWRYDKVLRFPFQ